MKRKWCVVCVILLFITISMFGFIKKDLDDITGNRIQNAHLVFDEDGRSVDIKEFLDEYGTRRYCRYRGFEGSTAKRKWIFTDNEGNVLFQFTYLGNNNLVAVLIEGKRTVYKSF